MRGQGDTPPAGWSSSGLLHDRSLTSGANFTCDVITLSGKVDFPVRRYHLNRPDILQQFVEIALIKPVCE